MCWRAAYGIADRGVNRQVEVGAGHFKRIGTCNPQFITSLPPAVFADDDTWIELAVEARLGAHCARRGPHLNPISVPDPASCGSCGIQFDLGMQCTPAQTRQGTMLSLTKQTWYRASQDQREGCRQSGRATGLIGGSTKSGIAE